MAYEKQKMKLLFEFSGHHKDAVGRLGGRPQESFQSVPFTPRPFNPEEKVNKYKIETERCGYFHYERDARVRGDRCTLAKVAVV